MSPVNTAYQLLKASERPRVVVEPGAVERAGEEVRGVGGLRPGVVTDRGLVAAGHAPKLAQVLRSAGLDPVVYDAAAEDPTDRDVEQCREFLSAHAVDCVVALGGGSAIDTAKGAMFLLSGGGSMADYRGFGKAAAPMLPLVAIPTTAGTGSEFQSYALVVDSASGEKMACGDPGALPAVSILDPLLTFTQPDQVTAQAGLDAIGHATEAFVTLEATDASRRAAGAAFALSTAGLAAVRADPDDENARSSMLIGSALGGMAIEASMLGAAHACANPLSAMRGIAHGTAVALVLPSVVRFNGRVGRVAERYRELAVGAQWCPRSAALPEAVELVANRIEDLRRMWNLPGDLRQAGFTGADLETLAEDAAKQWTARFNPRPVTSEDLLTVYRAAL